MKSKLTINLSRIVRNYPAILLSTCSDTDDARDALTRQFESNFGYVSNLCLALQNGQSVGEINSFNNWDITPIGKELLPDQINSLSDVQIDGIINHMKSIIKQLEDKKEEFKTNKENK